MSRRMHVFSAFSLTVVLFVFCLACSVRKSGGPTTQTDATADSRPDTRMDTSPDSGLDIASDTAGDVRSDGHADSRDETSADLKPDTAVPDAQQDTAGGGFVAPVEGVDIDASFAAFLKQVNGLWAGQDADFDGDGFAEVKVKSYDPAGDTQAEYWGQGDGVFAVPVLLGTWTVNRKTGNHQLVIDKNHDGVPESQTTETSTGREVLEDRGGKGVLDWRRQELFQPDGTVTVTLAHLEGDTFVTDTTYTVSRRRPKCGTPNPGGAESKNSTLAPDCLWDMPYVSSDQGGVLVSQSGDETMDFGGHCSNQHRQRIFDATMCAKKRFDECLSKWNSEEAARFAQAWAKQPLQVDCAIKTTPECNGINAASDDVAISIRPPLLDPPTANPPGLSDEDLCLTMFHEMMHWAGTPDSGNLHGDAVDRVYACSRFCDPRCDYAHGVDPDCGTTPGSDCAICVMGKDKNRCGGKTAWVQYGDFYTTNFCMKGTFTFEYADCSAALGPGQVFCDGSIEPSNTFTPCCVACPEGFDNGLSCSQWYPDAEEGKVTFDAGCKTTCGNVL